jgi:hypothetical protein
MSRTINSAHPICLYDTDRDFTSKKKQKYAKEGKGQLSSPVSRPTILPIQEGRKIFPKR